MGYRDNFYIIENIIGYTGAIHCNPTVYFQKDDEFGHITQDHDIKENIGREAVGRHSRYSIGNELVEGSLTCVERTGPHFDDIFHVSRNKFVGAGEMKSVYKHPLNRSILNFTKLKAVRRMNHSELKRLLEGTPVTKIAVGRLIRFHERRIALAGGSGI